MLRRRETASDDWDRDLRLLKSLDGLEELEELPADPHRPLDAFETVVLFGVGRNVTQPYPPPGHGYPRR